MGLRAAMKNARGVKLSRKEQQAFDAPQ